MMAGPMITKLYTSFVRDLKDQPRWRPTLGQHRRIPGQCNNSFVSMLIKRLLYTFDSEDTTLGFSRSRTEEELNAYYNLQPEQDSLRHQLRGYRQLQVYLQCVLKCIKTLRSKVSQGEHVDFLSLLTKEREPEAEVIQCETGLKQLFIREEIPNPKVPLSANSQSFAINTLASNQSMETLKRWLEFCAHTKTASVQGFKALYCSLKIVFRFFCRVKSALSQFH
eukprot:Protomagalhaensia_wolfi_Nauph_80__6063@NODE_849_length_1948_cov_12_818753_g638_i0_p2_GENE_NODE_849_length_1948_cov_12_818753_g638_i0NODE_849_length_1948_cov_12_818753_g638_i0_p2_ORF_typecomplete_len232_score11_55CCM2_C/PF16545_5/0_099_NODE_849_length_1948_cov_12_818753_g638_i029697